MDRSLSSTPQGGPDLEQRRFVSQVLSSSIDDIAQRATTTLLERWDDVRVRYQPHAHERWRANFVSRVADLASAVLAGKPEAFIDQVRWSRVAFESRGVPLDDLQRSVDVLGEVIDHFVPVEDQSLIEQYIDAAGRALYEPVSVAPTRLNIETPQGELAAKYLVSILEGDRLAASTLVVNAVRNGMLSVPEAYLDVLEPVQHELGRMWHMNELTVAEEHAATQTTMMVISQLYPYIKRQPRHGKSMLACCVAGNSHDLGMRIVADYFEMAGWRSVYLGADVPSEDVAIAVEHFNVQIVCLSASMLTHLNAVEEAIAAIRAHPRARGVKVLVGGAVFGATGEMWRQVGADAVARSPAEAVRLAHAMLGMDAPPPAR